MSKITDFETERLRQIYREMPEEEKEETFIMLAKFFNICSVQILDKVREVLRKKDV